MKLQFWGAARTVTGSMHLLEVNDAKILLDCGLYQGKRKLSYERNLNFPFDPKEIDVMVLSHAHIDHSGNIPNLVRQGFKGNIYTTHASRDLCAAMLEDSARIQEQDIGYLNKKRRRKGEPPLEPLYTVQDALGSLPYFIGVPYWRPIPIAPGVTLTFHDAGHILGSAIVELEIKEKGETKRLVFSGDLGRRGLAILRDPEFLGSTDYLIMESPIVGSDSWGSPETVKLCGKDCYGSFFCSHYAAAGAKGATKAFIDRYTKKYKEVPDDVAALTWDSLHIIQKGIESCAKLTGKVKKDREALRNAIAKIKDFKGITGNMTFTENGDPIKCAVIVKISDKGEYKFYKSVCP